MLVLFPPNVKKDVVARITEPSIKHWLSIGHGGDIKDNDNKDKDNDDKDTKKTTMKTTTTKTLTTKTTAIV